MSLLKDVVDASNARLEADGYRPSFFYSKKEERLIMEIWHLRNLLAMEMAYNLVKSKGGGGDVGS